MQTLQLDQRSLLWEEIREPVLAAPAVDGDVEEALRLLRGWDGVVARTLGDVYRALREQFGKNSNDWRWGELRQLTLQHPVGEQAPMNRIYNRGPFPWGGDSATVGQAAVSLDDPTGQPFFIASLRMVVDVGNWDENRFVLPGGQSDNPLSPHYDDQIPLWREGQGLTIAWTPEQVAQATASSLTLQPALTGA